MAQQFKIVSAKLKSMTVNDPDGVAVSFDSAGVALTTDEYAAAHFAACSRFLGTTVTPEPTPIPALPPRVLSSPTTSAAPATKRVAPGAFDGELGQELQDEERIPNERGDIVSPLNAPLLPEVLGASLITRYPDVSDRLAIVDAMGLRAPELFAHVAGKLDGAGKLEALQAAFPELLARVQELEQYRTQAEAYFDAQRKDAAPTTDEPEPVSAPKGKRK